MLQRKVTFYALLIIALAACTKQDVLPVADSSNTLSSNSSQEIHLSNKTILGLAEDDTDITNVKADMNTADVNIVRKTIFLSETTSSRSIDNYLSQGYSVQIVISWFDSTNGSRGFPKDTTAIRSQADAFFQHYLSYKKQIPFVAIENEWDYEVQHGSNLQDYLNELSIINSVGHKYGFKIADGGITSGALQRWTYSQLAGTSQQQWKSKYYVGLNNNYDWLMNIVNTYIASAKKINFDYSNAHWYNSARCGNGFSTASQTFLKACNKKIPVCNEFGIRTNSLTLFTQTDAEIKGRALYAVAYSGSNIPGKAITLTDAMLQVLK
ncbi:MAG: hypothetical protein ABJB05_13245 [Parafilimonas sp.]